MMIGVLLAVSLLEGRDTKTTSSMTMIGVPLAIDRDGSSVVAVTADVEAAVKATETGAAWLRSRQM